MKLYDEAIKVRKHNLKFLCDFLLTTYIQGDTKLQTAIVFSIEMTSWVAMLL